MRVFPTEVLLSVSTGLLLCEFGKMHECIEFLAGGPVFTHQLAYKPFADQLAASVLTQHPDFAVDTDGIGKDNWQTFLIIQIDRLGPERPIVPMAALVADTIKESFSEPLRGKKVITI